MEVDKDEEKPSCSKNTANKRFEVKQLNAVALRSWDTSFDTCAICRNHIMEPCIECQANLTTEPNGECSIAYGVCNHAFHLHCISRWLQNRQVPPRQPKMGIPEIWKVRMAKQWQYNFIMPL